MWQKYKPYILSVLVALAVGGLSALLTSGNMNLYEKINRPPLSPPSILFPIVWTFLYILMGISSAMIFLQKKIPQRSFRSVVHLHNPTVFQLLLEYFIF